MADLSVQELYELAHNHWKAKEIEKAAEYIEQALKLSPEDLNLHALALHIKSENPRSNAFLPHAEFIMDHDIHFKDPHNEIAPDHFMTQYFYFAGRICKSIEFSGENSKIDPDTLKTMREKYCHYVELALKNGYDIFAFDWYIDTLIEMQQYDKVLKLCSIIFGSTTAAEAGLPGLEKVEMEWDAKHQLIQDISRVLIQLHRYEEARDFMLMINEREPDMWIANDQLGIIYSRLDHPAECARQWVIAIQKRGWYERYEFHFDVLCNLVLDPLAAKKYALTRRIHEVMETVPPENRIAAKNVQNEVFRTIGDRGKQLPDSTYVESKLGIALPPEKKEHYDHYLHNLWIPSIQGEHPFDPEPDRETEAASSPESTLVIPFSEKRKPVTIERYGIDLTELARNGKLPPITGRDAEIDSMVRILLRMEKNNPVLLGAAGTGKTAIVQGLAQRIVSEHVPPFLKGRRVVEISMNNLVAGTTYRGDFEKRVTDLIIDTRENPDIILFVDELHTIMGAGTSSESNLDAANIVKPALAKGTLRLAGATTTREYGICIEKDPAMARRFTPVRIGELNKQATVEVLRLRREFWLQRLNVIIPDDIIIQAVDLVDARIKNRAFPDKAIDLLDESCAFARTRRKADESGTWTLSLEEVHHVLRDWTGGMKRLTEQKPGDLSKQVPSHAAIVAKLSESIIGQDRAVEYFAEIVMRIRMSLKDPTRPLSLLLYGPEGCGKAAACDTLSSVLWPDEADRLMTLNCQEFTNEQSLFRLIGPPPGYHGCDEGGILQARLKRQPHSIIVLSNIAAAHHRVLGFFEQLLRHGSYTGSMGQTVMAADTIIVFHVNSSQGIQQLGFGPSTASSSEQQVLQNLLKSGVPESLCSLFTCRIPFEELSADPVRKIVEMRLRKLQTQYAGRGIEITFSDTLPRSLAEQFLKLPPQKRNLETLIDSETGSGILDAIINNGYQNGTPIEIGVRQKAVATL